MASRNRSLQENTRAAAGANCSAALAPSAAASSRREAAQACLLLALLSGCGGRAAHSGDNASEVGGADSATAGASANAGGGSANAGGGSADAGGSADGGASDATCGPGSAPLRRLTRAEFAKTAADLFGEADLAVALPPDVVSFPIGNLAEFQSVGVVGARGYFEVAQDLAKRATVNAAALARLAACAGEPSPAASCARTTIETFATKAFRRKPTAQELTDLVNLHSSIVAQGGTFAEAIRAVITAVLQAPEFLYRIEWGTDDGPRADLRRLSGDEMATRLSYLFWGGPPDEALRAAAQSGALLDPDGIAKEAARLLDDPRSRAGLAAFFDDFLQLELLPQLSRSDAAYSPVVGEALREGTQRFLESQIFDHHASWQSVLTSNKAFVTGSVASLYGVQGVSGDSWQEVSLDSTRLGLLTHPSWLMVSVPTNATNPVLRGYAINEKILCRHVPEEPPGVLNPPPEVPVEGTTRERFTQYTSAAVCRSCHQDMNQLGYAFEAFDSLGRYRTQDSGKDIDTNVDVQGIGPTKDAVDMVERLAALPETQACFAQRVAEFSLGKSLASDPAGTCLKKDLARRFEASGYNVRQLLLDITQTDAFLYLPKDR